MDISLAVSIVGTIGIPVGIYALTVARNSRADAEEAAKETSKQAEKLAGERQRQYEGSIDELRKESDEHRRYCERLNTAFSQFQLDTAQRYATMVALKEMETRWANMFIRIEDKLDRVLSHKP